MCAIVGALYDTHYVDDTWQSYQDVVDTLRRSRARGRDGFGWLARSATTFVYRQPGASTARDILAAWNSEMAPPPQGTFNFIANLRAEPTTEFVASKKSIDQQPYALNGWSIVHNGTVANDAELRTHALDTTIDSAAIVESLGELGRTTYSYTGAFECFLSTIRKLQGSFAILAVHESTPEQILAAANYKPIWYETFGGGVIFASSKEYLPDRGRVQCLPPYSAASFVLVDGSVYVNTVSLRTTQTNRKALIIASGGLDSTVAAKWCIDAGFEIRLLHFTYGCRAETNEIQAVRAIAEILNCPATFLPFNFYEKKDSRLFDTDTAIAGGEEGAEFAHEWVPARNLVMLSIATAYAEANGYGHIVLGNNLEEAGAYPDNEPEFIRRFNEVLPFAVADGKQVQVIMPVGDLMKHEIVALGHRHNAPLHATWSCYRNGEQHCGKCGPCFMRRTAFAINNIPEVIEYEE